MDAFCSPDRVSTAGTDILATAGWFYGRRWCGIAVMAACAGDRDAVKLIPGDKDV